MGYLRGMGDVASSDYVNRSGVCKPTNFPTLEKFKTMQVQLNRVAGAVGVPKTGVDGDIGQGTLYLLSRIGGKMSETNPTEIALANEASSSCAEVAVRAEIITYFARAVADAKGAPQQATPSPGSYAGGGGGSSSGGGGGGGGIIPPVTGPGAPTQPAVAGGIMAAFNNLGTLEKAAVVVGGVALFVALRKKGKRKSGSRR